MRFRATTLLILACTTAYLQGCASVSKKDDFSSLMQPASLKYNDESPPEPTGRFVKTRAAFKSATDTVGRGVGWVGKRFLDAVFKRKKRKEKFDPDSLWKQGYGFNNPNNDRVKANLPPKSFSEGTD